MIGIGFNSADTPGSMAIDLFSRTDPKHTVTHCFMYRTDNGGEVIEALDNGVSRRSYDEVKQSPARRGVFVMMPPPDKALSPAVWAWAEGCVGTRYDWRINFEDMVAAPWLRWLLRIVNHALPTHRINCMGVDAGALKAGHTAGSDQLHEFMTPVDLMRWAEQHGWSVMGF